jgi:hypothetical protein
VEAKTCGKKRGAILAVSMQVIHKPKKSFLLAIPLPMCEEFRRFFATFGVRFFGCFHEENPVTGFLNPLWALW